MTTDSTPTATPTATPATPDGPNPWTLGDYPRVAREVVGPLGGELVRACRITAGQRVLDVAAGSGNAALAAADVGAEVIASDLTPSLLDAGRLEAELRGIRQVTWQQADAEDLPFRDDEFDVVMSSIGAMFAPHHQKVADELVRVCRPGGVIGMINWAADGFIGEMFTIMRPHVPTPARGTQPPAWWGREEHVRALFGDRVRDLEVARGEHPVTAFRTGTEFRDYFKAHYGPTIATYRRIAGDAAATADLDAALAAHYDAYLGDATTGWGYLLVTATKA